MPLTPSRTQHTTSCKSEHNMRVFFFFMLVNARICLISICLWSVIHFPLRMLITCKSYIAYLIYNETD